jgi:hypothetical protein
VIGVLGRILIQSIPGQRAHTTTHQSKYGSFDVTATVLLAFYATSSHRPLASDLDHCHHTMHSQLAASHLRKSGPIPPLPHYCDAVAECQASGVPCTSAVSAPHPHGPAASLG